MPTATTRVGRGVGATGSGSDQSAADAAPAPASASTAVAGASHRILMRSATAAPSASCLNAPRDVRCRCLRLGRAGRPPLPRSRRDQRGAGPPDAALRDAGAGRGATRSSAAGCARRGMTAHRRRRQPDRPARGRRRAGGRCCSARTWTPCATPARYDGPLGRAGRAGRRRATARRARELPFALEVAAFADEEGAALRHRLPRQRAVGGQLEPGAARPAGRGRHDAGATRSAPAAATRTRGRRAAAPRATAGLLRGPHRAGAGARGRGPAASAW